VRSIRARVSAVWFCGLIVLICLPNFASPRPRFAPASIKKTSATDFDEASASFALVTYLGGSGVESAAGIAVDALGNMYVAGTTSSTNLPVSPGGFQPSNQGGDVDGFVMKLSPTGSLVYSTYLGGKGRDEIYGLAVDRLGNAYVTGFTDSKNFPATEGALGGKGYYFTAKLNATGSELMYSTRGIGGRAIAVDSSGNAYVAGATDEKDFTTTPGAFQTKFGGGQIDAFVAKLNAAGDALVYATYLGGAKYEYISAIAVDPDGNAYAAGNFVNTPYSEQGTFPTTPGAYLEGLPPHPAAFVSKLNSAGSALIYSTYVEASTVSGIAIDADGNAYVTGDGTFIPATANAFQKSSGGVCCYYVSQFYNGGGDAFVMKLNRTGSALVYSTYLGGSNYDAGRSIAVDSLGNAYVVGFTDSADFPVAHPLQTVSRGIIRSDNGGSGWNAASRGLRIGDVRVLVTDPRNSSTLYAGSQLGLFKSTDRGNNWTAINDGLTKTNPIVPYPAYDPAYGVRALVIDPANSSTLYAVLESGLFKSTDGGNSWNLLRSGFVGGLAFNPADPSTIYAAAHTVIKSRDGGITWTELNLGPNDNIGWVNKVVVASTSPPTIFADLFLEATNPESIGVVKSTDGGITWRNVGRAASGRGPGGSPPNVSVPLVVDPRAPSIVYAGSLKSTDSGETWNELNFTHGFINALAIDPAMSSTLYAAAGQYPEPGVYKSTDGGASWSLTPLNGAPVYSLAIDSNSPAVVYAGTGIISDAFLTKLDPAGSALSFSTMLGGFGSDGANSVAVDPLGNVYIGGATASSGLPVANALQAKYGGSGDAFVAMIGSLRSLTPRITGASINGKTLTVFGESFDFGATILIDGKAQAKTENDQSNPGTALMARKSAARIAIGQTVKLQVRNPDSTLSPEFSFTRP
jgi:hypothetical protein